MGYAIFLDSFTCLDDLKGKDRSNPQKILAAVSKAGRFSCFDVDDRMAQAMTWLCQQSGWIICRHDEVIKDADGHGRTTRSLYPWTYVTLTDEGRKALGEASGLSPDFSAAEANANVDVNHPSSNGKPA